MSSELFIGILYGGIGMIPSWGIGKSFPNIETTIGYSKNPFFGMAILTAVGFIAGNVLNLMINAGKADATPITDTGFQSGVVLGSALGSVAVTALERYRTRVFRK
jgi:hypothetical protein